MKHLFPFLLFLLGSIQSFSQEALQRTSFTPALFDYMAPVPMGGEKKCVVELWQSSCNYFIVNIDAQKNWNLEKAEYGITLLREGIARPNEIEAVFSTLIAEVKLLGVDLIDLHIIRSSSAHNEAYMPKIEAALNDMGFEVIVISQEMESKLAILSILPDTFHLNSFVLEIGSLMTRISWPPDGNIVAPGSKYFQTDINPDTVFNEVKVKSLQIPSNFRKTCFIIGGAPYEFAKQTRKNGERYTVLEAPANIKVEGNKQKAGLNIYDAVAKATGCKQFVFDWDANYAIGYLLTL